MRASRNLDRACAVVENCARYTAFCKVVRVIPTPNAKLAVRIRASSIQGESVGHATHMFFEEPVGKASMLPTLSRGLDRQHALGSRPGASCAQGDFATT